MIAEIAPNGTLVPILIALLGGGLVAALWQIYVYRRQGKSQENELVTRVSNQVITGAQGLLNEYRIQIEADRQQIDAYLTQLSELNRLLGEANARIERLEKELKEVEEGKFRS
jgi:chromosome segregation ATPase